MRSLQDSIGTIRDLGARFKDELGLDKRPGWSHMKDAAYFDQLLVRCREAEKWAAQARPKLTMIGDWHMGVAGYAARDVTVVHRRRHEWTYGVIKELLTEPLLVSLETVGRDGILDPAQFIATLRDQRVLIGEKPFTHKEAVLYADVVKYPAWMFMKTKKDVRFICGEEWPFRMHLSLLITCEKNSQEARPMSRGLFESIDLFLAGFRVLRSNVMVIRTLEWLKRTGRPHGVMEQGSGHQIDIEDIVKEIGLSMDIRVMPSMELVHV